MCTVHQSFTLDTPGIKGSGAPLLWQVWFHCMPVLGVWLDAIGKVHPICPLVVNLVHARGRGHLCIFQHSCSQNALAYRSVLRSLTSLVLLLPGVSGTCLTKGNYQNVVTGWELCLWCSIFPELSHNTLKLLVLMVLMSIAFSLVPTVYHSAYERDLSTFQHLCFLSMNLWSLVLEVSKFLCLFWFFFTILYIVILSFHVF